MIPKHGKKLEGLTFYRPINLLPVLSKFFRKLYSKELKPDLQELNIILDNEFWSGYGTTEW